MKNGSDHIRASFYHEGTYILSFGIRHDRTAPHGYIPSQMHLSETEAVKMASCLISKEEYIEKMKEKGIIDRAAKATPTLSKGGK